MNLSSITRGFKEEEDLSDIKNIAKNPRFFTPKEFKKLK